MTVKQLIEKLQTMDPEMPVRVFDSYWNSEGFGPHASDLDFIYPVADTVEEFHGSALITSEG